MGKNRWRQLPQDKCYHAGGSNTDIEFDKASLYEYTREWVHHVNRGGLIEVTDDFFLF